MTTLALLFKYIESTDLSSGTSDKIIQYLMFDVNRYLNNLILYDAAAIKAELFINIILFSSVVHLDSGMLLQ